MFTRWITTHDQELSRYTEAALLPKWVRYLVGTHFHTFEHPHKTKADSETSLNQVGGTVTFQAHTYRARTDAQYCQSLSEHHIITLNVWGAD